MRLPEPILVTGGTGFVGTPLTKALTDQGYNVTGAGTKDGNLCHSVIARELVQKYGTGTVFHLAAKVGGIGANRAEPYAFWKETLEIGMNVLDASLRYGTQLLIQVGSICCYPLHPPIPFPEFAMWNGFPEPTNSPYGIAKRALQTGTNCAARESGGKLHWAFPLPTNMYGPGENFDLETSHVIPALIRKFVEATESGANEVVLWGTGSPTRDFLYVDDAVTGLIACAEYVAREGKNIEAVNLGSGHEISIEAIAKRIKELAGFTGKITWDSEKPDGQPRRWVDSSRALALFQWEATTSLERGLHDTIEWYKAHRAAINS